MGAQHLALDSSFLLPMLYVARARQKGDKFTVLVDGIDLASASMTAFKLG